MFYSTNLAENNGVWNIDTFWYNGRSQSVNERRNNSFKHLFIQKLCQH